jgi:hypothetical protein
MTNDKAEFAAFGSMACASAVMLKSAIIAADKVIEVYLFMMVKLEFFAKVDKINFTKMIQMLKNDNVICF